MNSFLNLLCHEFVLSTTHLLGECFLRIGIVFVFSSSTSSPFFFLYGMCSTYPRLINSCSSCSEMYALSRHKCCSLLLRSLGLCEDGCRCRLRCRLITTLSTTSVTCLISWVLAGDITTDKGTPLLSVKICLFVPRLLLSVDYFRSSPH